MIRINPGDPPILVAEIPKDVDLPCSVGTSAVYLSHDTYLHIIQRRIEIDGHVDLVLRRIDTVIAYPTHAGFKDGRLNLFRWTDGDPAGVLVCLKCLHAETWVNTAFPVGRKRLLSMTRSGKLLAL